MRARSSGRGAGPSKLTPVAVEPAAVAGALELVLGGQPVRRAAEVGADGDERVEALRVADDPHAEGVLPARVDLAHVYSLGKPTLKAWGGSKRTFGKRKRVLATRPDVQAAEKATQPTVVHFRKPRRETPSSADFALARRGPRGGRRRRPPASAARRTAAGADCRRPPVVRESGATAGWPHAFDARRGRRLRRPRGRLGGQSLAVSAPAGSSPPPSPRDARRRCPVASSVAPRRRSAPRRGPAAGEWEGPSRQPSSSSRVWITRFR